MKKGLFMLNVGMASALYLTHEMLSEGVTSILNALIVAMFLAVFVMLFSYTLMGLKGQVGLGD